MVTAGGRIQQRWHSGGGGLAWWSGAVPWSPTSRRAGRWRRVLDGVGGAVPSEEEMIRHGRSGRKFIFVRWITEGKPI